MMMMMMLYTELMPVRINVANTKVHVAVVQIKLNFSVSKVCRHALIQLGKGLYIDYTLYRKGGLCYGNSVCGLSVCLSVTMSKRPIIKLSHLYS